MTYRVQSKKLGLVEFQNSLDLMASLREGTIEGDDHILDEDHQKWILVKDHSFYIVAMLAHDSEDDDLQKERTSISNVHDIHGNMAIVDAQTVPSPSPPRQSNDSKINVLDLLKTWIKPRLGLIISSLLLFVCLLFLWLNIQNTNQSTVEKFEQKNAELKNELQQAQGNISLLEETVKELRESTEQKIVQESTERKEIIAALGSVMSDFLNKFLPTKLTYTKRRIEVGESGTSTCLENGEHCAFVTSTSITMVTESTPWGHAVIGCNATVRYQTAGQCPPDMLCIIEPIDRRKSKKSESKIAQATKILCLREGCFYDHAICIAP